MSVHTHLPLFMRSAILCWAMSVCSLGWAVDHDSVQRLMRQARYSEALAEVEQYLSTQARDPQMLFWRAKLQADLGRQQEAFDNFYALTLQYPELPEPHNNLGVIYAARGQWGLARESLEMALRNNPNDATALENLGDVLLQQSRLAYEKALKLNPISRSLPRKLQGLPEPVAPVGAQPSNTLKNTP